MKSRDIIHLLPIKASLTQVYDAVSTPNGLNHWWTKECTGRPEIASIYNLDFGSVVWQAQVTEMVPLQEFELTMTKCDPDWSDTQVRFQLEFHNDVVSLKFSHLGWAQANDHFYGSNHCWGLYLRIMRRWLENQEEVSYENRLQV